MTQSRQTAALTARQMQHYTLTCRDAAYQEAGQDVIFSMPSWATPADFAKAARRAGIMPGRGRWTWAWEYDESLTMYRTRGGAVIETWEFERIPNEDAPEYLEAARGRFIAHITPWSYTEADPQVQADWIAAGYGTEHDTLKVGGF